MCINAMKSDNGQLLQKMQQNNNLDVQNISNLKGLRIEHKYVNREDSNTTTDDTTASGSFSATSNEISCDFDITTMSSNSTVRFSASNTVKIIENRQDISNKVKRKYWYGDHELDAMRPTYQYLNRAHQNCGKKNGCIRGLETPYWLRKMAIDSDFTHLKTFVPPPKSFLFNKDNNNNNGQQQYRNYVIQSQQRARIMALMDERYVMEHMYGLPCSHTIDVLQNDKWECLRCCSCHSDEISLSSSSSTRRSSPFRKVMKGMRKRISMSKVKAAKKSQM